MVAVRKGTNKVIHNGTAVGWAAKDMLGKTPGCDLRDPSAQGRRDQRLRDHRGDAQLLHSQGEWPQSHPSSAVVIAIPSGITAVEKRAVLDSAERAGARRVYLVEEPMAAGIGAGLPIVEPTASMIVDVGGGTTEVAIMSLGDIATCESARVAGDDFDESIIGYMKKNYSLTIGEQTSERIKIEVGSASPLQEELKMEVRGRDMVSGMPRKTVVTSEEIREALSEPVDAIIETVMKTLEQAKPELAGDLVDNGITLAGGGALLRGLDEVLLQGHRARCPSGR